MILQTRSGTPTCFDAFFHNLANMLFEIHLVISGYPQGGLILTSAYTATCVLYCSRYCSVHLGYLRVHYSTTIVLH